MDQSLALFQKRDDLDELEGFQQQELAKVKHMVPTRLLVSLLSHPLAFFATLLTGLYLSISC